MQPEDKKPGGALATLWSVLVWGAAIIGFLVLPMVILGFLIASGSLTVQIGVCAAVLLCLAGFLILRRLKVSKIRKLIGSPLTVLALAFFSCLIVLPILLLAYLIASGAETYQIVLNLVFIACVLISPLVKRIRSPKLGDPFDLIWSAVLWGLAIFSMIIVPIVVLAILVSPGPPSYELLAVMAFLSYVAGYPLLVAMVVLIPALALAQRSVRRRRAAAVLEYLQQAFRLNLPLSRYLQAASRSEKPLLADRLEQLRLALETGRPLATALRDTIPEMPARSLALIEHAERVGNVPQVLDRLNAERLAATRRIRPNWSLAIWYPPLVLLLVGAMILLVSIFVAPKLTDIFKDFHVEMPALTRWIYASGGWVGWPSVVLAFILVCACGLRLREVFHVQRPNRFVHRARSFLLWNLPIAHGMVYDRSLADLCTALADSVDSHRTFDQALSHARELDLLPVVERRLRAWNSSIEAGQPVDRAARSAGFPSILAGMMSLTDGSGLSEALRFLARFYSDRTLTRQAVLSGIYLPVMTVSMGVVVGTVAVGFFLPLQRITSYLAGGGF